MAFIFLVNIVIVFRILDQYKAKCLQEERGILHYVGAHIM